jgi:hypothetical protein
MSTNHDTSHEPGYSDLSNVMAAHPEIAIFRTFSTLNTQSLLYLQAELMHLEKELEDIREDDNSDRRSTDKNWLSLQRSLEEGRDPFQWAKFLDIRTKLAEYSKSTVFRVPTSSSTVRLKPTRTRYRSPPTIPNLSLTPTNPAQPLPSPLMARKTQIRRRLSKGYRIQDMGPRESSHPVHNTLTTARRTRCPLLSSQKIRPRLLPPPHRPSMEEAYSRRHLRVQGLAP